jgi:protein-tyrosine phosphatase
LDRTGVLFVCLGNICRSPLAEGIFLDLISKRGLADRFDVDSCGTGGWHHGEPADPRSVAIALKHGLELAHQARQFNPRTDPARFPWIIAMDRSNVRNLIQYGANPARVRLMRTFDRAMHGKRDTELDVPDPYSWSGDGFEDVYQMLAAACGGLVEVLVDELES